MGIGGGPVEETSTAPTTAARSTEGSESEGSEGAAHDSAGADSGEDRSEHQPVRGLAIPFRSVRRGAMGWSATPGDAEPAGDGDDSGSAPSSDSAPASLPAADDD